MHMIQVYDVHVISLMINGLDDRLVKCKRCVIIHCNFDVLFLWGKHVEWHYPKTHKTTRYVTP